MKKILYSFVIFLFLFLLPIPSYAQDITSDWFTTTSLPYAISSHTSFSAGEKVSVVGGSAVTGQSKFDVKTSAPSSGGSLGSWNTTLYVPNALIWHTTTLKDNYVYVLGGREENPGSGGGPNLTRGSQFTRDPVDDIGLYRGTSEIIDKLQKKFF